MLTESITPHGECGVNEEPSPDIIQEPTLPELSKTDVITIALHQLAESDPDPITQDMTLRDISKQYGVGRKALTETYSALKTARVVLKEQQAPPPAPEDIAVQMKGDQEAEAEQAEINKGLKRLQQSIDLLPEFHRLLTQSGYICDELLAASIWLSHGARLLHTSSAFFFTGASGSGKTDALVRGAAFLPPEAVLSLTSISDQALHYLGDIKHKYVIFGEIAPRVDEQDDARQMAMRQLISENKITRLTVEKPDGKHNVAVLKETEGPCVVTATTTKEPNKFNDELQNRASWVPSNDSDDVTRAVLFSIAAKAANPVNVSDASLELGVKAFQEFHRTLEPLSVTIPFASEIMPTSKHVTVRRLFNLVLNYIRANALLHQHSRQRQPASDGDVIVAEPVDYALAYKVLTASAPRVLEACPPRARQAFDEVLRSALSDGKVMSTGQIQALIRQPDSTVRRWLSDLTRSGLLVCYGKDVRQNVYTLAPGITEFYTQDLGLVPPDRVEYSRTVPPEWAHLI